MRPAASLAALAALSNVALGTPIPQPGIVGDFFNSVMGGGQKKSPSLEEIQKAQLAWRADTERVSQFLSNAESLNPDELKKQAKLVLDAENDELIHKTVLDRVFIAGNNPDPAVQEANKVLVDQGTFQLVVDTLKMFADYGSGMLPQQVSAAIRNVNQNRCTYVLPNIDKYFQAARDILPTDIEVKAARPDNCP